MKQLLIAVCIFAVFFSLPLYGQAKQPTRQQVIQAVKDADYAVRRFRDVKPYIDLNVLGTSGTLRDAHAESLRECETSVTKAEKLIALIETTGIATASQLFLLDGALQTIGGELTDLGELTVEYATRDQDAGAMANGQALADAAVAVTKARTSLVPIFWGQLLTEEDGFKNCAVPQQVR